MKRKKNHLKHYLGIYAHIKEKVLVNEKLYHLGRTFVIERQAQTDKKKEIVSTFKEVKNDDFLKDLIICMDMINYHFPNLYQEGLANTMKYC